MNYCGVMMNNNRKKIKAHYNKRLKNPSKRKKHFEASGALGNESEGRQRTDLIHVRYHNDSLENIKTSPEYKLKELKEKGKITL